MSTPVWVHSGVVELGRTEGFYTLGAFLGKGSFGQVFSARRGDFIVAVKRFSHPASGLGEATEATEKPASLIVVLPFFPKHAAPQVQTGIMFPFGYPPRPLWLLAELIARTPVCI
jgi:serine/threonine protein kinase